MRVREQPEASRRGDSAGGEEEEKGGGSPTPKTKRIRTCLEVKSVSERSLNLRQNSPFIFLRPTRVVTLGADPSFNFSVKHTPRMPKLAATAEIHCMRPDVQPLFSLPLCLREVPPLLSTLAAAMAVGQCGSL